MIHSLSILNNSPLSANEIANHAITFEQKILNETVGSQDQIACSLGGMNFIEFGPGDSWSATKLSPSSNYLKEIESRIVLLFSGISRLSSDVSKSLIENLELKKHSMTRTEELANECRVIFESEGDLNQIGSMLNESWKLKKSMNPSSVTPLLQDFFEKALKAGAQGGKILGAGGGGFFLFWVDPEIRDYFINEMSPSVHVPIQISNEGTTRII